MRKMTEKQRVIRTFDRQAAMYDRNRDNPVLGEWRRRLLADARGEILEAAVGAGANFPFYPKGEARVTAVDISGEMLKYARRAARQWNVDCTFIRADLEEIDFPPRSFDRIISTMSLCSYANPVRLLRRMNRWCRPDGQILLMEHGLSSRPLIRLLQHAVDPLSRHITGCHINRDLDAILAQSGLRPVRTESRWMGIVRLIWAVPGPANGCGNDG